MTRKFVVVHEAPADFITATELADRVLVAEIEWLEEALLDSQRQWVGNDERHDGLTWKSIPARARELGIRVQSHFDGQPGMADAKAARRAIAYILRKFETVHAILLIRDMDDQPERHQGLEQAKATYESLVRIVIGLAIVERESWIIGGFEPADANEQQQLAEATQLLGFNPCLRSHELTACKDDQAKKSPKRVLAALTGDSLERESACWRTTQLTVLEERGAGNGLKDYFQEVRQHLVPLIAGQAGRRDRP